MQDVNAGDRLRFFFFPFFFQTMAAYRALFPRGEELILRLITFDAQWTISRFEKAQI